MYNKARFYPLIIEFHKSVEPAISAPSRTIVRDLETHRPMKVGLQLIDRLVSLAFAQSFPSCSLFVLSRGRTVQN